MKKLFITLIVSVFFVTGVISQNIVNYAFTTNQTAVLADMSSGTTQLIGATGQNLVSDLTTLGFNFYFMGVPYTQFSVNSNGQMSLGNAVFSGSGISNAAPNTPLIVPISGTNTLLSTGKVHYKIMGTAPNRILVVEWKDLYIPSLYDNGTPPSADITNQIQAQLHETTGIIEFKYGIVTNNNAPTTLRATFISSSNTATTVKSVGSSMIAASAGFPVATYPMNSTNTNLLNSRTYTFTPPAALTAPTWAVTPFRQVTTTGLNLYWANHAPAQTAVNIYRSDDAGLTYVFVAALNPLATSYVATLPFPGISSLWEIAAVNEGAATFSDPNSPLPIPVVSVVDCGGTSTLTASGYTGTLLWSTGETTPSISVNAAGVYTVTQTIDGLTSLPGSGTATPVPTVTGPTDPVTLLPASLSAGSTPGQIYTTEPGMNNYVWAVSGGNTFTGQGTNSITVNWVGVSAVQTVSVTYQNPNCSTTAPMTVYVINYYPYATNIDATTIPQFVDPVPHFAAGLRVNAKNGGDIMVKTKLVQQIALSTGTVTSTGVIGDPHTPNAGKGNYAGYGISTDNGNTFGPFMWPAQTIEARTGNELRVTYVNGLYGVRYSDFNILADQTLLANGYLLNGDPLKDPYNGDIPMVTHLHGGEMPSGSDGGPTGWFMPEPNTLKGPGYVAAQSDISTYPNKQESGTLWYHPHDQGLTRINVYTGLAGYYFLRGDAEEKAKLPGWSGDDKVQEVTPAGLTPTFNGSAAYLPEIELAVQDRMFNVKGELYWPCQPTNPDIHPYWTPEFFGDVMTVNGKSWPYLSVAPRKYRFRVLDGCNARFLNMWLANLATGTSGPKISVVGSDGNFLDTPADLDPASGKTLFMAPGERYDVVIDFSGVPQGTVFTMMNDAPAPYPTGTPVSVGTTDRIMQFVVNGNMMTAAGVSGGQDKSLLPQNLRTDNPMVKMTDFAGNLANGVKPATKREILLNEVTGPGGPVQVLFNNSHFDSFTPMVDPDQPAPQDFGALTERPLEGTTEVISIINTTIDAHPIHIHLTQWQLVSRQAFDRTAYLADYCKAFAISRPTLPIWPAGLGYPGGTGSPYDYEIPNADGALGGNPAIKPYLRGPVMPALPQEMGWKDDIKAFPGEVTTFVVRIAHTDAPIASKPSDLLLAFDPSAGPGYVWHCHIIDHEDMDMMRPLVIVPSPLRFPQITTQPKTIENCNGSSVAFGVSATTMAGTHLTYQWQLWNGTAWTNLANGAPYTGVLTSSLTVNPIVAGLNNNRYRVVVTNEDGVTTSNEAMLKVVPTGNPTASVTIAASANPVLRGQLVTITPTPVYGGTNPAYKWYKNSVLVDSAATYKFTPANGDLVHVIMTSSVACITGSPVTSSDIAMTVNNTTTGLANGDWNTPATWATGVVPTSSSNVVIPFGKTITINTDPAAVCNNLIVEGTLTSTTGIHALTVNGNLTVDGTLVTNNNAVVLKGATSGAGIISAGLGTLQYSGAAAQTVSNIDSTSVVNNLIIDNKVGVTLPASLVVNSTLTINAGAKLTNPVGADLTVTNVTINSDGNGGQYGQGTFVDNGNTYTNTGGVSNVQQYLTGGRNWYVSSPVTTAVPGTITSASLIQGYDEPSSSWIPESASLGILKGYAATIQSNGTVTFTGKALNTGVPTNSWMTNTGGVKSGYNLVGNPYPSYLNWDLVNAGSTNLESTMWYRTKNSGNTAYVFDTYNATGHVGTGNNGTPVTSLIPPVQSYWVRVADGFSSGILGVDNTMRTHDTPANRLKAPAQVSQQVLRLQVSNGVNSDQAIVLFNPKASNAFDMFDSEKMSNNMASVPEIYTLAGTEPLVINGLNGYAINDEIPVGFTTGEGNVFTIKATEISNFDSNTKIVLVDKLLNNEKELVVGNNYSFSSDATNTATRFSIAFKAASFVTNLSNPNVSGTESMYVFRNSANQITVHRNDAIGEGTVTVYSAVGQKIISIPTTGINTLINEKLLPGIYVVTLNVQDKISTKKITL